MQHNIKTLQNIVSRKGSSKVLTFSMPHVFKALQLLINEKYVSRSTFSKKLQLGEGAIKTLISHLKEFQIVDSTRSGTYLTSKGKKFAQVFQEQIPQECVLPKSDLIFGNQNYAILIRNFANYINTGIEQRDFAMLYGAQSTITLIFKNGRLTFPGETSIEDRNNETIDVLLNNLKPCENDVIIITSSNEQFVSEIAAKNSALCTISLSE